MIVPHKLKSGFVFYGTSRVALTRVRQVIDSSVLVVRTRESILTVFWRKLGRSTQAGMVWRQFWKMGVPFMEINFRKGFSLLF